MAAADPIGGSTKNVHGITGRPHKAEEAAIYKNGRFFGFIAQRAIAVPSRHGVGRQRSTAATSVAVCPPSSSASTDGNF
jgi:hypothetical protein